MRVLILGGGGMLGHKLYQTLSLRAETSVTVRRSARSYERFELFPRSSVIEGIDVLNPDHLHRAIAAARPTAVINCVGIIKQLKEAHDPIPSISVNSLLPHRLAALSAAAGARFVHISTDCVFSGAGGPYDESSRPDAADLYGRSKLLGETDEKQSPNAITIRTSIIGREIETSSGLVEWFLAQRGGSVRGYKNAQFTGFTTLQLSRIIADILFDHAEMRGLWQVSSDSISKFDLLGLINRSYGLGTRIDPDVDFHCDRRLDSTRFREATGFRPLPWPEMIEEMRHDPTPYEQWRTS
jgi:dTDP-4-dehydrorhamnose reductase